MDERKPLTPEESTDNAKQALPPKEVSAMPKRSRLAKTLEKNSKKTIFLSLGGIMLIIALVLLFGIPFLEQIARLTSHSETNENNKTEDETLILLPPFLTASYEATNSAEIDLSGTAEDGDKIKLYRDGKLAQETKIEDDNSFTFSGVELREGTNSFKAKVFKDGKESKFSDPITISYLKDAPKLSLDYPQEGQGISHKDGDRLRIEGTTDPDVTVTINGFQAVVDDEGKFSYVLQVSGGDNTLKAVATDAAGNKTEVERKFTYNP